MDPNRAFRLKKAKTRLKLRSGLIIKCGYCGWRRKIAWPLWEDADYEIECEECGETQMWDVD